MTNADYLAKFLAEKKVTHVYELIGGMITFLLDALHRDGKVKIVSVHHEQGAAFAAEGWARITGVPGVALATSGPGATNLITGIGSCYFDSVPAVFITGQVNRHEQKLDRKIRQLGFQETDIVSMVRPIVKNAWLVNSPEDFPRILEEAFALATSGRPGPVLIDIPMDVQRHELVDDILAKPAISVPTFDQNTVTEFRNNLLRSIAKAKRPLILAGGGIRSAGAGEAFRAFVDRTQIPVVHSLMGVDVLPSAHSLRFGMIGSYGNRWSNLALAKSDFVLVLGSRLDIRQTGSDVVGFQSGRTFFHVDCEEGEINNRVQVAEFLHQNLADYLPEEASALPAGIGKRSEWLKELVELKTLWPDTKELEKATGINPNRFLHELSRATPYASAYVSDVGQHQMWAAQSLELLPHQRFLTSGGMGAMGFGLPAAIGASVAGGPVVLIAGDGGFQLNIQELQTIQRNQLPVKIVILNNRCHGMVRQFQESYFKERYQSTLWGYDAPDFVKVAQAYGFIAVRVDHEDVLLKKLEEVFSDPNSPALLEVAIDVMTNVYPKLAFGRNFGEMEPMSKPLEMEGT